MVRETEVQTDFFRQLASSLHGRREEILRLWRATARQRKRKQSARHLSRTQLNDHIPEILDAFENRLRKLGKGKVESTEEEVKGTDKHGLHRWQQGYQLPELVTEWGHLYECVLNEVEDFAENHPRAPREVMRECRRCR